MDKITRICYDVCRVQDFRIQVRGVLHLEYDIVCNFSFPD